MTPKAQQLTNYDVPGEEEEALLAGKKQPVHQRNPSSSSSIGSDILQANADSGQKATFLFLINSLTNRLTSVISPYIIFFVATPIAVHYPLIQLIMLFAILIGTSPLYFIIITFIGKSNKHHINYSKSNHHHHNPQPHRRQPSIVGSIAEMSAVDSQKSIR